MISFDFCDTESIPFHRIKDISVTGFDPSRFDLKTEGDSGEIRWMSFFVLNGPTSRMIWFIQRIAEKAFLDDPFREGHSQAPLEPKLTRVGKKNDREFMPHLLVTKPDDFEYNWKDSFSRLRNLVDMMEKGSVSEEIIDALNLYGDSLSVPAIWFFTYLRGESLPIVKCKRSQRIQELARSLDFLLETQEPYLKGDLESFSAFFRMRNESLNFLRNSSSPHKRRHPRDKIGLVSRYKGKGFCTFPTVGDFSKASTLLELRENSKRQNLRGKSMRSPSSMSPTIEKMEATSNWRLNSVNVTALLKKHMVGDTHPSIVRPYLTDILFRLAARRIEEEDPDGLTTYEVLAMLLANFNEDVMLLRELTHLLYGNLDFMPSTGNVSWPNLNDLYERLSDSGSRVSHRIVQSAEVHNLILDVLGRAKKIKSHEKALLPYIIQILWVCLSDNYFSSLPKHRVDVSETFSTYIIDFLESGSLVDSFAKDALIELLFKETPIYDVRFFI
jgi:hypothetical protein